MVWFKIEYKPRQVVIVPPPPLGNNLGFICVTNFDDGGAGYLHLPLNFDATLSMSTLKKVFPEATGLYYYAFFGDNSVFRVPQDEERLFPPSCGEEIIYSTTKKLLHPSSSGKDMKDNSNNCVSLIPKDCSGCSDLKMQVDQMKIEISELKKGQNASHNNSQLNANAKIFKPALVSGGNDSVKNNTFYFKENEEIGNLEEYVEMKKIELIDLVSNGIKSSQAKLSSRKVNKESNIQSVRNSNLVNQDKSCKTQNQSGIIDTYNTNLVKTESETDETSSFGNFVQFHLQRGSSFELGIVKTVGYNNSSGKGAVEFSSEMGNNVVGKKIEIGDCSERMGKLTEDSVQTQIMLESKQRTVGWERSRGR